MLASWLWRASRVLLPVLCLLFASPAAAQNGWRWISPLPTGNVLNDLHFVDGDVGIAVGDHGTIIRTEDGGESWKALSVGTQEHLRDVEFFDGFRGAAVGDRGTLLVTDDGGATWFDRSHAGWYDLHINGIAYAAADTLIGVSNAGSITRITDGGRTWEIVPSLGPTPYDFNLYDIAAVDSRRWWIVGSSGVILHTGDGGQTWSWQRVATVSDPVSLTFLDDSTGVAVGESVILRTTDGGETWTELQGQDFEGAQLRDVWFANAAFGLAAGGTTAYSTVDGGLTWQLLPWKPVGQIHSIRLDHSGHITVAGSSGILTSANGGMAWDSKMQRVTEHDLRDVWQIDRDKAVAVGDHVILRTADGAVTWAETELDESVGLNSVRFFDSAWGVAVGSTILTTSDGGVTWAYRGYPDLPELFDTDYLDANSLVSVGAEGTVLRSFDRGGSWSTQDSGTLEWLHGVTFVTPNLGWIVGDGGTVLRTTDGGATWLPQAVGIGTGFSAIAFVDEWIGVIVGEGERYRTTDGGDTWVRQGGIWGARFDWGHDIDMVASGLGVTAANGLDESLVRVSINGGEDWPGWFTCSGRLGGVHVLEDGTAMAVGLGGLILRAESVLTGAEERPELAVPPTSVTLDQNYPNPFNPVTTIAYELARHAEVTMTVHDQLGRAVRTETLGWQAPGRHDVTFDAAGLSSGIYFYTLTAGDHTDTRKMVLIR